MTCSMAMSSRPDHRCVFLPTPTLHHVGSARAPPGAHRRRRRCDRLTLLMSRSEVVNGMRSVVCAIVLVLSAGCDRTPPPAQERASVAAPTNIYAATGKDQLAAGA